MISKQGRTLQGVGLTQGNTYVTTGTFKGATTFHCIGDGDIEITWIDDNKQTLTITAGTAFPIVCKSIKIVSGTFCIGYD